MIEITFPLKRWAEIGNEALCGVELLSTLRRAGVPAVGRVSLQGVEHGTLAYTTDKVFGDAVYQWTPGDDEEDPAAGL